MSECHMIGERKVDVQPLGLRVGTPGSADRVTAL